MLKFLILLIPAPLFYFFPLELLLISLTTLISLTLYPQINRKTTLIHHESSSLTKTLSNCKTLKTYNPSIFLFNGFLQGLFGITLGSKPGSSSLCEPVTYEREHLRLPDGGEISIDWLKTSKPSAILVVAAGLGADSSSQSTRSVALEAKMKGLTVAVIHGRGISCELKTARVFNLCVWKDFEFAVRYIHMQHPGKDLVGLGMSMGGAILAKYASKTSEKCLFKALVTVAAPFNFLTSAEGIRDKWNGLFDSMLLAVLKGFINNKRKELEKFEKEFKDLGIDFEQVLQSKSCCEFDDRFTAKMMGLKSYKEYYLKGSCVGQMHRISIPFLALHAKDDPIVSYLAAPQEEFRKSKNMVLALTTTGGHVGFFKGNCPPKRWFQVPCVEFLLNSLDSV